MKYELINYRQFYPSNYEVRIETRFGTYTTIDPWLKQFYPTGDILKTSYGTYITKNPRFQEEIEIERLLNKINDNHEIDFKIELVCNSLQKHNEKYNVKNHEEIYSEIEKYYRTLIARGKNFRNSFKNTSGTTTVGNTLIIKINGNIEWYVEGLDNIINFLKSTLNDGIEYIEYRLSRPELNYPRNLFFGSSEKENRLIKKLLGSAILGPGKAIGEFPIGNKRIDLIYFKENEVWIVEAKEILNFKAIGQVMCYSELFDEIKNKQLLFRPKYKINKGIVYSIPDNNIELCCKNLGITLFRDYDLLAGW